MSKHFKRAEQTIEVLSREIVRHKIFLIRSQKVMRDSDLAELYGVSTKRLNEQVRRNPIRFPPDFMFRLTLKEAELLRSQIATSKTGRGGRRYLPLVFSEQGVAMLSSVLKSERAALVNVAIMRAFVRLREALWNHKELAYQLDCLEGKVKVHDSEIRAIFDAIRSLVEEKQSAKPKRRIGFHQKD